MKKNNKIISSLILIIILILGTILPIINAETPQSTIRSNNNENNIESINLTDGLVGYWSFNNQSNVAYDDSGNNNNGINHGASWVDNGYFKGSMEFEIDNNEYIGFQSPIINTPPYTICAWVNPDSLPENKNNYFISNGGEASFSYGFYMFLGDYDYPEDRWQFGVRSIDGIGGGANYPLNSDNWTFICGSWDGTNNINSIKLYVNGELKALQTPQTRLVGQPGNLRIGTDHDGSQTEWFDGLIDEVRIYNRVLNNSEIYDLYISKRLIGYWSFNNESDLGYDDSGNNNQGTNHGATWFADGIIGGALDLERDNENYMDFSNPIENNPPYSICLWVKPESLPINDNWYILCNGAETSHSYGFSFYIKDNESSSPKYHYSSKRSDNMGNGVDYIVNNNDWIFLCGTWDGLLNENSIKFYVNGELYGSNTPIENIVNGPIRNLFIGKDTDGWGGDDTGHYYDGLIDEIRIYKGVLNQEEIQELYLGESIIEQNIHDRGFPIRHASDGEWGGSQTFKPSVNLLTGLDIYIRKFNIPEFNLSVELRKDSIEGPIIDSFIIEPEYINDSWEWHSINLNAKIVSTTSYYFILFQPPPENVTTSYGYEWGYAFGNQYNNGSFWFTRDGGNLWRELPTMYDYVFRIYGQG